MTYGGDEISALVLDIGSATTRAGYAGDDTPRAVFSTTHGFIETPPSDITSPVPSPAPRLYMGDQINEWRPGMHATNPMRDGLISEWSGISPTISHAFNNLMKCDLTEHPVLVTEPAWNTVENRQRMAEIMFEEFKVPAFYIANSAVLSSFASGKGTSLIIDVGKSMASVIPVSDGFVLRKGMSVSSIPQAVSQTAARILLTPSQTPTMSRGPIDLLPHHLIASKRPVPLNAPPQYIPREDRIASTTVSWRNWAQAREIEEWMAGAAGIIENGWHETTAASRPPRHYEFPTGYNTHFSSERFIPGEMYFKQPNQPGTQRALTIPEMLQQTLHNVEPDLRAAMLSNVVVTGGGSLIPGMVDRISNELGRLYPAQRIKLHAPGNPTERKYAGWLGGSVLASLGTFHQLWISAEEWQEHGKNIVTQRCK